MAEQNSLIISCHTVQLHNRMPALHNYMRNVQQQEGMQAF